MQVRRSFGAVIAGLTIIGTTASTSIALGAPAVAAAATKAAHVEKRWSAESRSGTVRIAGTVPRSVQRINAGQKGDSKLLGAHAAASTLSLNFGLPLHNMAGLNKLIASEAKSHRYISRAALYNRYAPPQSQVKALKSWLRSQGFTITHVGRDRTSVSASAPTSTVQRALALKVNNYQRSAYTYKGVKVGSYAYYSTTANPRVPARLGIQTVSGLSSVSRFFTSVQLAQGAANLGLAPSPTKNVTTGSKTAHTRGGGGYYPEDIRAMYDEAGHGFDGTGQTLGFTLWGAGETQAAMSQFATTSGDTPITVDPACVATGNSPNSPSACVSTQPAANHLESILENGNTNGTQGNWEFDGSVETALDIEQAHGEAPGAAMKYYVADCSQTVPVGSGLTPTACNGSDVGMEETVEDAADDPTLHTVSNSWGYGGDVEFGNNDPFKVATENSLAIAAAAGTTFWFSTGDTGTVESGYPADSDYVVGVGGTSDYSTATLPANNPTPVAARSTATTWAAGGSWCSNLDPRPSWQTGSGLSQASCPGRVVPDVSAIADTNTAVLVVATSGLNPPGTGTPQLESGGVGGTSVAAPEMNGMEAVTENFIAAQTYSGSTPAIGFEGPMIYQLGDSSHASGYFNDVICGNTASPSGGPDGDSAQPGWDPATGFGEIDWFNFATGYAIALGAQALSQPASIDPGYAYSCAKTPSNASERGVSMPTKNVGYALGSATSRPWPGTILASNAWGATNTFLKTTDGGVTWQSANSDMMSIACTSATTCTEVGDGGRIRRTTDAGATWPYLSSPTNKALTSIACPTSSVCYAAGDRGTVLKSTDGGASWSFLSSVDGNPIYGLSCPTAAVCYAVDGYAHAMKTVDGGSTWSLQTTPVTTQGVDVPGSGGPNSFAGLFGISCTDVNTCVAVGGFPPAGTDPPIVRTTNGGLTWTLETSNAGSGNYLNHVACVGSTCYAVGRTGAIVTSTDGGLTWVAMTSNTTASLSGISCTSAAACVATGQNGVVNVLSGGTWTPTTGLAQSDYLASVTCLTGNSCMAAGKQGVNLAFDQTNVAGSATLQSGGGSTQQMNSISCVDANDCVAVGNAGTIITTTNAGQTWLPSTSGVAVTLSGVSCVGTSCEAVGAITAGAAVILGSTNGGSTWTPQTSGVTAALAGVACSDANTCEAVGAAGEIVATTNGGGTWAPQTSGVTAALTGVTCPNASDCFAVGAATGTAPNTTGTVLATTNGGGTWSAQTSHTTQGLTSVACVNAAACFATGAIGTVISTVDGGNSWAQQGNPISGPTTALNAGPTGITATFATACTSARCVIGTASAGNIMTTPLLTVTLNAGGTFGATPDLSGLAADDSSISYSPASESGNVTGTLTCSTTATSTSDVGSYPVSECSGLSDPGFSVVYDLAESSYAVGKADQTITFGPIADHTFGDPTFNTNATASSGLAVTYGTTGECSVAADGTVTLTGAGSCTITASQSGNNDYNAADDVQQSFNIAKSDQSITFGSLDPKTFGDATFGIDPTASSGLPVSLAASGSCTLDSATAPAMVSITGAGSCQITASQAGDDNYNAADDVVRNFDVSKANQTLTFGSLADKTFGDADFTVSATASSGDDVSYSATGECTVDASSGLVHIIHAGSCTITASQAGDDNFNPASDVQQSFDIAKAANSITFGSLGSIKLSDGGQTMTATADGGTVTYGVSGPCQVTGDVVTPTAVGDCEVTASDAGGMDFLAATPVTQDLSITKGDQTITFGALSDKALDAADFTATATATSGLTVSFSSTSTACTVSPAGGVTIVATGTCQVTAAQAGDTNWNAATSVSQSFTVTAATPNVVVFAAGSAKAGRVDFGVAVAGVSGIPPTGTVVVAHGSKTCTVTLSGGGGDCKLLLGAGSKLIKATYSGDSNYLTAVGRKTQSVSRVKPTISATVAKSIGASGKTKVTVSTTLAGVSGIPLSGSVRVVDGHGNTCSSPVSHKRASCTVRESKKGTYTFTVRYGGNTTYTPVSTTKKVTVS